MACRRSICIRRSLRGRRYFLADKSTDNSSRKFYATNFFRIGSWNTQSHHHAIRNKQRTGFYRDTGNYHSALLQSDCVPKELRV